ncbi:DUF3293 domain-containing protein [Vibrio fluvialis]|uniref:DUF3293 domain-containing protein n=1 Tax=Vibrio fluvialis TaxID=676 RepID=UPI001F1BCD5B|nr:DUF3293 domain-containing protein [Vibrio fluvialis]EKO3494479.1 DUF3293 domain-containing protein [Vibrio fluvialis]MCE7614533.1 DUF3293 domain-containing protein [Vibrio fluvialis]
MMMIDAKLWQAYANVRFAFESPLRKRSFAIITAWNPKSQRLSNNENCVNNQRLQQSLINYDWSKVVVGDYNFDWYEESFAVSIPLDTALQMARDFGQNAIYYVIDDELMLHSCVDDEVTSLGSLQEKLT